MARIRSIKPEFPQSESMGNVSRDARLTFIEMWTLADDEGRLRGNSRMLASLLFPYDNDAPTLIDKWLGELDREGCIQRYVIDGASYIQICNWLNHQKIDHASKSKIPPFAEGSRILANPREPSCLDQGEDQGSKDQGSEEGKAVKPPRATRLSADWVLTDEWLAESLRIRPEWGEVKARSVADCFRDYWIAKPGKDGRKEDWLATWRNWVRRENQGQQRGPPNPRGGGETVRQAETRRIMESINGGKVIDDNSTSGETFDGQARRVA